MPSEAAIARAEAQMRKIVFGQVYPLYVKKVTAKGRTEAELLEVIRWLTGYSDAEIAKAVADGRTFEGFFAQAPAYNPAAALVTGVICGYRVEDIADPLQQKSRRLDKLIDDLAKGRAMTKILRH